MPKGAGRKLAYEWTLFQDVENNKAKCKKCDCEVSAKIERIRSHIKKCKGKNETRTSTSQEFDTSVTETESTSTEPIPKDSGSSSMSICICSTPSSSTTTSMYPNPLYRNKQLSMADFTVRTTEQQKDILNLKIAKFFYANNIPFNVASNSFFKEMIEALRPGYTPPDRIKLGGSLLNSVAENVDVDLANELSNDNCTITLMQDGWSNIKNDPIVATSIHTGHSSFLLNTIDCEMHKKTAEFCAEIAKESILECQEKFNKSVFAICTDNENKMIKMRSIIQTEYPNILTYGCSAHYMNLLEVEITPQTVLKHIIEVQKFFRNHHQPHGWLREKDGNMPQIPNDTRWNSQYECVNTYILNYHKYVQIRIEHSDDIPLAIIKILDNVMIYQDAVHLLKQLKTVSSVLDKMQSDSTNISSAVELWLDLLHDEDLQPYNEIIKKRMDQALLPLHFFANITDPKYRGRRLTSEQDDKAENWLVEMYPDYLPNFLAYKIMDTNVFPSTVFEENVIRNFSAAKWWQIVLQKASKKECLSEEFCKFVFNIQSCPATSASIERIFSTFGLVWSKLRNRLGAEKAQKLVKIYRYLRHQCSTD